jgi:hypothetical protein
MTGRFCDLLLFSILIPVDKLSLTCFCAVRTDPDRPYSFYDLSRDSQKLLSGMEVQENVGFTRVAHWPPKKKGARSQAIEEGAVTPE